MLTPKFDLFVFDWDGTIMDSTTSIAQSIERALTEMGYEAPDFEKTKSVIGLGWTAAILTLAPDMTEEKMDAFNTIFRRYYVKSVDDFRFFPGMKELLVNMHNGGCRLAVATGNGRRGLTRLFNKSGIGDIFEASVTPNETLSKPNPEMLFKLSEMTGVDVSQMVMVGDTSHDIQMAKNAGAAAVAVSYGAFPADALKAFHVPVCANVTELAAALGVEEFLPKNN